jgi:hypothetical protein
MDVGIWVLLVLAVLACPVIVGLKMRAIMGERRGHRRSQQQAGKSTIHDRDGERHHANIDAIDRQGDSANRYEG